MERSRNRRSRQGQDVDISLHGLDLLLVVNAESLLLIHYQKPEILELDVFVQKAVGAYDYVYSSVRDFGSNVSYVSG